MTNEDADIEKLYFSTISADAGNDVNADGRFDVGETVTLTDYVTVTQNTVKSIATLTILGSGTFAWTSSLAPGFGGTADVLVASGGNRTYLVFVNGRQTSHTGNNTDASGAGGPRFGELIDSSTLIWQAVGYEPGQGPACFCRGTMIATEHGDIAIEDLRAGDKVLTRDNGFHPIRWVGSRIIPSTHLDSNPKFKPIRITSDSLGPSVPSKDLLVSPQHRIVVRSQISKRMFGADEVLVPAVKLIDLPGIYVDESISEIEYFHMLFDRHEVVVSNGAESESLHTGPFALRSVSPAARTEIYELFPELMQTGAERSLARPVPKGKEIAALVRRHVKNEKPLQIPS